MLDLLGGEGGRLLRLAPLLRRQGLLMAGGVDQGQLQLVTLALELLLALPEIMLLGRQPGGIARCGSTRLEPT